MRQVLIDCWFFNSEEIRALRNSIPSIFLSNKDGGWISGGYRVPPLNCWEYNLLIQCLLLDRPYPLSRVERDALLSKILDHTTVLWKDSDHASYN
jgi:hypothetical protein